MEEVFKVFKKYKTRPHCNDREKCHRNHIEALNLELDRRLKIEEEEEREYYNQKTELSLFKEQEEKQYKQQRRYRQPKIRELSASELEKLLTPPKWTTKNK